MKAINILITLEWFAIKQISLMDLEELQIQINIFSSKKYSKMDNLKMDSCMDTWENYNILEIVWNMNFKMENK